MVWSDKRKAQSIDYPLFKLILEFTKERNDQNQKLKFEWIPSHLDRKCKDSKMKKREARIQELNSTYGEEIVKKMIEMNNAEIEERRALIIASLKECNFENK